MSTTTPQTANAPLVMQAKGLVKRYGQVGCSHGPGHHGHGVAHADFFGVDHGRTFAQAGDVDAVGNLEHMGHVVADEDHGQALVAHAADQLQHHVALLHAQGGGGLVHDDDMARKRCRARHGNALALAA